MAETIGSLTDKITIIELKRYHMYEQTLREDVSTDHLQVCQHKLNILTEQRDDLVKEINQLFQDIMSGEKTLKMYKQYKMYNDPTYRIQLSKQAAEHVENVKTL